MDVAGTKDSFWNGFYWLGIVLVLFVMVSSIFLSYNLKQNEVKQLKQEVKGSSEIIVAPIKNTLEGFIQTLSRMAKRWEARKGTGQELWFLDANNYYQDARVFQTIEWVDPQLHIRQAVPAQENKNLQGYDLSKLTTRTTALEQARREHQPIISQVINLLQGPKGILIIVPLYLENVFGGYIVGTLNVKQLMQLIFLKYFEKNYGIAIYQNDVPMFSTGTPVVDPSYTQEKIIQIRNVEWKFYVWPNANLISNRLTFLPTVVLFGGIVVSLLMLIILYFYHRLRISAIHMIKVSRAIEKTSGQTQKIMETINEGFITIDQDKRILYMNPYAEEMLGYHAEEVLGKDAHELMVPERYRHMHRESIDEFIRTGSSNMLNREIEFLALAKDGHEFPVEAVIIPIKFENNFEFHALIRDITARKKAEADQSRLVSIIDSTNDAIVSADLHGDILTWNTGAEAMYGYTAESMIGRSILTLYPENKKADFKTALKKIKKGEYFENNDTIRIAKDGRIIPVSVHVSPIRNKKGIVIGGSSITRDISESKKIETMKNEFIAIVSHELRTPLTSIRGSLGILKTEKICPLSDQAKELLDIANNNCERLIRLINDILDIEKIEAGRMEFRFKRIELNKLIQETIQANLALASKQDLKIDFSTDEIFYVWADQDKLTQVITNLLSNAIRYSPQNGVVKIRLTNLIDKVRVSVIDNGPGIPKEFRNKIFDKFTQADSSDARKLSGTGLGLNISKVIIERHGGNISFLTTEGKGSTFYFDLPIEEKTTQPFSLANHRSKILICDPDIENADQLHKLLLQRYINSDIVASASEAKRLLKENTYAAIAIDLLLPDEDGVTFIKELRNNPYTSDLPIIVISMQIERDKHELKGDILHVIDWIKKPITKECTLKIIDLINTKFSYKIPNILNVEDDNDVTRIISIMLQDKASVWNANTLAKAKKLLSEHEFDLVILDLNLPDGYGTELIPCINYKTRQPIPVIVFSVEELDKEYSHLVSKALLKSIATNEQLYAAIESAIQSRKIP